MATTYDGDSVAKAGFLFYKNKGHLIKKFKKHNANLFKNSASGVARLELYENEKDCKLRSYSVLIPGSEVVSVRECLNHQSAEEKFGFIIATKEQQYLLCADNKADQLSWLQKTQSILFQPYTNSSKSQSNDKAAGVTLDNDIYEPADDFLKEFRVTTGAETRQTLGVEGEVRLVVENGHITIITLQGNRAARWFIGHLRRFGYRDTDFHLEAGRKSELGEGHFAFITKQGKQIHSIVTKEKQKCRETNGAGGAGAKPKLQPGIIHVSVDEEEPPLTTGGHIYEDITILKPTRPPPEKPLRVSQPKKMDSSGDIQGPTSFPLSSPTGSAMMSINNIPSVKSQPTHQGVGVNNSSVIYQPAKEALEDVPHNPRSQSGQIYSNTVVFKDAWKTYGRNDQEEDMNDCEEEEYERLNFGIKPPSHKRKPPPSPDCNNYGFLKNMPVSVGKVYNKQQEQQEQQEQREQQQQQQQRQQQRQQQQQQQRQQQQTPGNPSETQPVTQQASEPIYAEIDKSKKLGTLRKK